jgi:hypothetical protein
VVVARRRISCMISATLDTSMLSLANSLLHSLIHLLQVYSLQTIIVTALH